MTAAEMVDYNGNLKSLRNNLEPRLATQPAITARLPHGARVTLLRRPEGVIPDPGSGSPFGLGSIVIFRLAAPVTDKGWKAWEREIAVFSKHLSLGSWHRKHQPIAKGVAVRFDAPETRR